MRARTLLGLVIAAAFAAPSVLAADHGAGARFHATTSLQTSLGFDPTCAGLAIAANGGVIGTELGAGAWSGHECLDFVQRPGTILVHGSATVTAADGSRLFLTYDVVTPFDPTGAIHATGTYAISGGTGRFAGATGSGTTNAEASAVTFTASDVLDGTIRLADGS
jgi:hypothetical protein